MLRLEAFHPGDQIFVPQETDAEEEPTAIPPWRSAASGRRERHRLRGQRLNLCLRDGRERGVLTKCYEITKCKQRLW